MLNGKMCRNEEMTVPNDKMCRNENMQVTKCKMSQNDLMRNINEVSFAVNDMQLYLDTHPHDHKALDDMRMLMERRKHLMEEYSKYYGPLTMDVAPDGCNDSWCWALQPWPWEKKKGRC